MKTKILNDSMKMLQSVAETLRQTIGNSKAETGGIGFGSKDDMIIRKFVFDSRPGTSATYTLNSTFFNPIIQHLWEEEGLEPLMIAHSHPVHFPQPSSPDIKIGIKYLERFQTDLLYFPIILSTADQAEYEILPFAFISQIEEESFVKLKTIEVIPDRWVSDLAPLKDSINKKKESIEKEEIEDQFSAPKGTLGIDYSRVNQAISISKMKASHILVVGTGGSATFCKQISRLSIGKLTLIDLDTCGTENIPRQSFNLKDALARRAKVFAIADEIKQINPDVLINPIHTDFTEMNDKTLDELMKDVDLILLLTDSFACQAFGNKVVLKYQKMGIWAGYYTLSRAAELFFYIPETTPSCFRCAVSSRYDAQAKKKIKITSASNTIFHSDLLDSYIGFIVLAMLHNDVPGFEFSNWFKSGFNHNLIQFKTSPSYEGIFNALHGNNPQYLNFGAVWQEINQETIANGYAYNCPDCASEIVIL